MAMVKSKPVEHKSDQQTREALISAGIQLIGKHGYDGASIGDIAAAANVTKGAVYYHFASKEDFVLELVRQRFEQNIENFKQLNKDQASLAEWIERSFAAIITFSDPAQQQFALELMMAGLRHGNERIRQLFADIHDQWRRLITEMVLLTDEYRSGQMQGDPELIAVGLMALIDGLLIHCRLEPETFTKERFIQRLTPMLNAWVMSTPAGSRPSPRGGE